MSLAPRVDSLETPITVIAKKTTAAQTFNSGNTTQVTFGGIQEDHSNGAWSIATNRFTCQKAGTYEFSVHLEFAPQASVGNADLWLSKTVSGGSGDRRGTYWFNIPGNSAQFGASTTFMCDLIVGDCVELYLNPTQTIAAYSDASQTGVGQMLIKRWVGTP